MSRILLVRHGEAGERSHWRGRDRERPLTAAGAHQAEGLIPLLGRQPIARLLPSGYRRCTQTVEPIAHRLALHPEVVAWLEEGAAAAAALRELTAAGDVLACTHGDVVSGVLFELADQMVDIGSSPRMQKGSTWILEVERGRVTSARYLPPPSPAAAQPALTAT